MSEPTIEELGIWIESIYGTRNPTMAAIIAHKLDNDERHFQIEDGADVHSLCREAASFCLTFRDASTCYNFFDDSLMIVTAERWEVREAGQSGEIDFSSIVGMEILPRGNIHGRGDILGRRIRPWCSEAKLQSSLPRAFGIVIEV